jgi:ESS family glutamate:Na+ symporter
VAGLVVTYAYVNFVCRKLFPGYMEQQFLAMFGMLTGTASTGVILLREIDGDFKTPVADNLVYQNFPAMVFGFPILILATMAPTQPYLTLAIVAAFFVVINLLLFRSFIFKKKVK